VHSAINEELFSWSWRNFPTGAALRSTERVHPPPTWQLFGVPDINNGSVISEANFRVHYLETENLILVLNLNSCSDTFPWGFKLCELSTE
jgi:hypothetical protein